MAKLAHERYANARGEATLAAKLRICEANAHGKATHVAKLAIQA